MVDVKKLIHLIPPTFKKDLVFLANKIKEVGHESFVIGGSVRDLILGKSPEEYDLATSAHPDVIKKNFKRVIETGIQHGTVTVMLGDNAYEITTYRKDVSYTDGRRPDQIEFGASLKEDMKRRDFTMNAIALDILSESLIDENKGLEDIQNKIIRTIGNPLERFGEDGLRPIRAIRFLSTLNFTIEPETYKAIFLTRSVTEKISKERFHDELNKILKSKNPYIGIYELHKNKIFELFTQVPFQENPNLNSLNQIDKLERIPLGLRIAFTFNLLLSNPKTDSEVILKDFRYSKTNSKDTLFYLDLLQNDHLTKNLSLTEIRKLLSKFVNFTGKREIDPVLNGYFSFLKISSDQNDLEDLKNKIQTIFDLKNPLVLKDLAVNGNDLVKQFPEIDKKELGKILQLILNKVLEFPESNDKESIYGLINNFTGSEKAVNN